MRVFRYTASCYCAAESLRLLPILLLAFVSVNAQAMTPKARGAVTMDVIAMDTAPAESASGSAPFPVALTVVIHSQVAIPNLQLRVKLDQAAFLSQGLQQWQGGIDAGETLRLSYVLESSADAESVRDKLCQFELYRMESGLRQWLSTADYALLKPGLATSAIRVPLQEQFADGVARLRHADGDPSSQRYLVEYPLD